MAGIPNLDRVGGFVNQAVDFRRKFDALQQRMAPLHGGQPVTGGIGPGTPAQAEFQALIDSSGRLSELKQQLTPADREAAKTQLTERFGEEGRCFVEKCGAGVSQGVGVAGQAPPSVIRNIGR